MSKRKLVHLHLHTQYSLLDGANKVPDILELAHKKGQPAIAMTDHGNMHGAVEFYSEAKRIGIKPIIGCELYVSPTSRFERKTKEHGGQGARHLTVLAKNMEGYKNLCKLVTLAYREGFYYKPRVDHELLSKYSNGLIALSGCMAGELAKLTEIDDIKKAKELAAFYAGVFKDSYYIEVQPHEVADQNKHNAACIEIAKELGLPLVVTNDCHYPTHEDHLSQEILMCVSTQKKITDPTRIQHVGFKLHLKDGDEVAKELKDVSWADEAIRNTVSISEMCNLDFDFKTYYMPKADCSASETVDEALTRIAKEGLSRRFEGFRRLSSDFDLSKQKDYEDRLEEEIKLIIKMGFSGYFLVVSDFVVWAKEQGIPVGPGRGSAAGSLVAYSTRITDIDPIPHKLLFERFLNPERISMPDIDVDFCITGRDKVIKYVVEKYGKENVAQICTFGTLKAKAAIRDVGRALGMSFAETDKVAQLIPAPRQGFDFSIDEAIKMEQRLKDYAEGEGKQLIFHAKKLEGLTRHSSTHAAGVVIGDRPLIDLLPLMLDKDGNEVTQYSMKYVEKIGLVKFDFLGLKTLTVIQTAVQLVKQSTGIYLDLEYLPLDDSKTYALLCSGNTTGIFQLESSGITDMTIRLKPNCFNDLTAILALYRPGPLDAGMVDHYIERKNGREPVVYLHPKMASILHDTYGIIVYQEQIMQLARELAGYSLGGADLLRRAMGKKNPEEMALQRKIFVEGAVKNDISHKLATEIFNQMETFARYGFNRSHSAAYAMISYQTAYLKAHYNVEFMAALMTHEMSDSDKTLKNLNECKDRKIIVLPPDVNCSGASFTVENGTIRFGLEAVKGIGEKPVADILEARRKIGKFDDLESLVFNVNSQHMNRRVFEGLIKCGALDFTGVSRREMLESFEEIVRRISSIKEQMASSQLSLFGDPVGDQDVERKRLNLPEWPINTKLNFEREALGFYISGHPLEKFKNSLKRIGASTTEAFFSPNPPTKIKIGGVVTALQLKNTKKGLRYATFLLEDSYGSIDSIVWPDVYTKVQAILESADLIILSGKIDQSGERRVLVADNIESLLSIRDKNASHGILDLDVEVIEDKDINRLLGIFVKYSGPCPVKVRMRVDTTEVSMILRDNKNMPVTVLPSEILCDEVEQVFGRPVLSFI